jgi:hypothetical protein
MISQRQIVVTFFIALASLSFVGCDQPQPIINIVDNRPKPPAFDERPRPILTAAVTGVVAAQPTRDDVGDSWIKRHIYTEGAPDESGLAVRSAPNFVSSSPAPQSKRLLSPQDFNPNAIY